MCAHITSVIWYLSYMRHEESALKNFPNWADAIQDASRETDLDESDSDDPEEKGYFMCLHKLLDE